MSEPKQIKDFMAKKGCACEVDYNEWFGYRVAFLKNDVKYWSSNAKEIDAYRNAALRALSWI